MRLKAFVLAWVMSMAAVGLGQAMTTLSPTLARSGGVDAASGTAYTRLYLVSGGPGESFDATRPTLTVECTRRGEKKYALGFGLNFTGVPETAFRPMKSLHEGTPHFDRTMDQREVVMEFLGYTRVKPMKRQFVLVSEPGGALVYNPPGMHSFNLEEAAYYLQYLRALPTFRMTYEGRSATFETGPLLEQIRREPVCGASRL